MAVNAIALAERSAPTDSVNGTPSPLQDLLALASWLAVHWADLDVQTRVTLARRIQRVASDLGRHANGNGNGHGSGDGPATINRLLMLTPREIEVLQAMADAHSTSGIAALLGISSATVRSHVKSLLAKLGLHSRLEAVSLILKSNGSSPIGQHP